MSAEPACPDENLLAAYVCGKASPVEIAAVEVHLDACSRCLDLVGREAVGLGLVAGGVGLSEDLHRKA